MNPAKALLKWALARAGYRLTRSGPPPVDHYDFDSSVRSFLAGVRDRGFAPRRILDVGANRGGWSRIARDVFPDADFTLVEPQVEMKADLDRFCAEAKSARWINAGCGATEGELALTVFPDPVSSSFAPTAEDARGYGMPQRMVRVTTLDRLCAGEIPDIVKIDAEGFEYPILGGAKTLLGKTELILLELMLLTLHREAKSFEEMVAIMADLGYVAYGFTTFLPRPRDGALGLCEVAFARRDGFLRANLSWM